MHEACGIMHEACGIMHEALLQLTRRSGNVWSYFKSRCCSFP